MPGTLSYETQASELPLGSLLKIKIQLLELLENYSCFPACIDRGTEKFTGLGTVYELHMGILIAFPNPLT